MQIAQYKPRIIEKILHTKEGIVIARFVVISENNTFKLKLVEMIPVSNSSKTLKNKVILLASPRISQVFSLITKFLSEVISPYSNLNFFISQPTRAPSL